ncbi:D-isomer specific 2-hydroxyacid dehydrogenase, NAD-binding [Thermoanaerobacter thermohydrosulfuricus WC1]|uniref:D-isomer specific 2-hydroxyacid dehydrogenase, NAD-binding n=1 Tax=Thermoanaerobacter thermohydrosulfuricus WC1 TaxID=1198630 RepID=M8CUE4_THETY|nr:MULTISPECIES: D-isomer specific 2-hydroxyacid dehydrogenase family protein [Thermoanaerobacter]EMT38064.1 D-isomer specific 2-hydroxyacid dehydrogenase, NAD-binding [Thermoanaerobacter thermohydrosulfuricus WC1]
MSVKIAIVNSSSFGKHFPDHIEKLKALGEVERFELPHDMRGKALAEKLMGYSVIIASVKPYYDREFFEYKDKTLLITRHGIGYDAIDIKSATEKGTLVTKVAGIVEREAVAENAIALLMDVMRRVREASLRVKEGKWQERASFMGYEIKDKVAGIIGIGNIGSRVAEILKYGFGAKVIAYDPNLSEEEIQKRGAQPVSLEELLQTSDIISLNASLNEKNYHMLSHKEFSMMKKNVFIVNTARGELIDTEALIKALKEGKVAGAGLDVVEGEPIDENHPLLAFDNVIITPHTSAYTYECLRGMGDKVVSDVEKVLRGEIPDGVINKEVLERESWKI